jgi:hypothetical protein
MMWVRKALSGAEKVTRDWRKYLRGVTGSSSRASMIMKTGFVDAATSSFKVFWRVAS